MPDVKSLQTILTVLNHAGFKNAIYITDRGYDSLHNLNEFILREQSFIMCVKTVQREVAQIIKGLGSFSNCLEGMSVDAKTRLYYR